MDKERRILELRAELARRKKLEKRTEQSYFSGLTQQAAQGATFGFVDEFSAAGGATGRALANMVKGEDANWMQNYDDILARERDKEKAFEEQNPVTSTTTNIAGGFANPLAKLPITGGLAAQAAKGAGVGVGMGAMYGAGNAEGDVYDGAKEAGIGAVSGGVLGAAAPVVLRGISKGTSKAVNFLARKFAREEGGFSAAKVKIANQLKVLGDGDINKGITIARQRIKEGGPETNLVDVLGMGGEKLARASANIPGKSAQMADDFVSNRMAGRGQRIQKAADTLAPNSFYDDIERITQERSRQAQPLYEKAFEPVSDASGKVMAQWDDRLQQFLDDPIIKKGMSKGIRIQQLEALAENKPFNFQEFAIKGFDDAGDVIIDKTPNLRAMDAAKRGLDDILEGYRDSTTGKVKLDEYGRAVEKVRKALVNKLDDISTNQAGYSAYRAAREAWSGPSGVISAGHKGRNFIRGDVEITRKTLAAMSESEKEAFRLGARRELSKLIETDTQTALNKFADKKQGFWNKLEAVFPDKKTFDEFRRQISNEARKQKVEQFMSPRAGSHTTPLKEDIAELGRLPGNAITGLEVLGNAASGHPIRAGMTAIKPITDKISAPNPKTAQELMGYLLSNGKGLSDLGKVPNINVLPPAQQQAIARALMVYGTTP